ncbi:MAG: hypothetical protein DMG76_29575 [Acidobacteria bacterium]|nr:MAG: hypothetical protein DMG76_29575 [Acidobacteriota bacterium]
MADDDLRVVIGRDGRRGAGTPVVRIKALVGVGAVGLLEPTTVRREGRERRPRTILEERVLHADEAGGCDGPVCGGCHRHQHGDEQTAKDSSDHAERVGLHFPFHLYLLVTRSRTLRTSRR